MNGLKQLNLPQHPFRLKKEEKGIVIFDEVRKKWLLCTPEEWVRQHFVMYLNSQLEYPLSMIQIEKGLQVHQLKKRCDILLVNQNLTPMVLVECKSADIKITEAVFDQIARYNIPLQLPYLVVTNGLNHYCCEVSHIDQTYKFIPEIPSWNEIQKISP